MLKYDAVVVGAGNAGLIAALRFISAGKRTLLIEQHNLPGGCATSFRRGRFEFDPSLHELADFGTDENCGSVKRIFDKYGIEIDWVEIPECFRYISQWSDGSGRMDVTLPTGIENFKAEVKKICPEGAESIDLFFDLCAETAEALGAVKYIRNPEEFIQQYPNFCRIATKNFTDVLEAIDMPLKVRDILSSYWSYLSVSLDNMGWTHYAIMVYKYIDMKPVIPHYTSHQISVALLEKFRQLGGEAWMNCRADGFIFEGDRCVGVKTKQGDIYADVVFANINPNIVYGKMVPQELVPDREKKLAGMRKLSGHMYVADFGLNTTAEKLGIKDYSVFFSGTPDSTEEYKKFSSLEENEFMIMCCHNTVNPDASPEGTCIVTFTSMYNDDPWGDIEVEDYAAKKNAIVKRMMATVKEQLGIDIEPYIEEAAVATPWTFARYLGVPEGAVYGYELEGWDNSTARTMGLKYEFPIKGLYPIGAAGPQGDGYSSTYISGDTVARVALEKLAKEGGVQA